MVLYDSIIETIPKLLGRESLKAYSYQEEKAWPVTKDYELVLQKEMAYELGGDNKPAVNFTCVTTNPDFFRGDEVLLCGPDLPDLTGSTPYARITLLLATGIEGQDPNDTESLYRAVQAMDFVKYKVYPEGYMLRTSGQSGREQVRVSRRALERGMTFEQIGDAFICRYKVNKQVVQAKVLFITAPDADYAELGRVGKRVSEITHSLSEILEGLPTECGSCSLKEICDEVEGLRELHFGQKKE